MICPSCRSRTQDAAQFCTECGSPTYLDTADSDDGPFELSSEDWKLIADEFREWHKSTSLTTVGHLLSFNDAWDNYFAGYGEGYVAGIQRALAKMGRQ